MLKDDERDKRESTSHGNVTTPKLLARNGKASMKHTAVVFDLWGTLVPQFDFAEFAASLRAMADAVGVDSDVFHQAWYDLWRERATGFFPTIQATLEHICAVNGGSPSEEQLDEGVRIRYAFTRAVLVGRPRPDAVATLEAIKARGLALGLVSNCSAEVPDIWPETAFAPLIDIPVFSCTVGIKKPDKRIYRMACEGLGVAPGECVYVGDGFDQELRGAKAVGMWPILMAPPNERPPDTIEWEGDTWKGERIETLAQVIRLVQ